MYSGTTRKSIPLMTDLSHCKGGSNLFCSDPESILERQAKAKIMKNLRRSRTNYDVGSTESKYLDSTAGRNVPTKLSVCFPRSGKKLLERIDGSPSSSKINKEQHEKIALSFSKRKTNILHEINVQNCKTPRPRIGPITSFSSRKRHMTYTVNQKDHLIKESVSSLETEQECKRSLIFQEDTYEEDNKENLNKGNEKKKSQILREIDLTSMNIKGSMLKTFEIETSKLPQQKKSDINTCVNSLFASKYLNENKENSVKSSFKSRLPLFKRSSIGQILGENIKEKMANKSSLPRRSMSAISFHKSCSSSAVADYDCLSTASAVEPILSSSIDKSNFSATFCKPSSVAIKVTKASTSSDGRTDCSINSASNCFLDSNGLETSDVQNCEPHNKPVAPPRTFHNGQLPNNIVNACETMSNCRDQQLVLSSSREPDNSYSEHINLPCHEQNKYSLVVGLDATSQQPTLSIKNILKNLQDTLLQVSLEQHQIAAAAEEFVEEIKMMVQTKTYAFMKSYESSLQPLRNLEKLLEEQLAINKDQQVKNKQESGNVVTNEDAAPFLEISIRKSNYAFLGTPMPTRKKRIARSLSHPQAACRSSFSPKNDPQHPFIKPSVSEEKNFSFSADESSPFTNLVGDCERPSLAPMTPKSRNNLFSLKENLNHQLDLLFE